MRSSGRPAVPYGVGSSARDWQQCGFGPRAIIRIEISVRPAWNVRLEDRAIAHLLELARLDDRAALRLCQACRDQRQLGQHGCGSDRARVGGRVHMMVEHVPGLFDGMIAAHRCVRGGPLAVAEPREASPRASAAELALQLVWHMVWHGSIVGWAAGGEWILH